MGRRTRGSAWWGAVVACWLCAPLLCSAAELPDLSDPRVAVETWLRLKGDLAGRTTYEWVTGVAYGVPADALSQPLFAIESVTVREIRRLAEDTYEERNFACRLYKDPTSGAYIDSMVNPFTRRAVELTTSCSSGPAIRYSPREVALVDDIPFKSTALGVPMNLELIVAGDQVTVRRTARSEYVTRAGETRRELSIDTFKLGAAELADPSISSLQPGYSWDSVTQWMTIFGMADTPGRMLWSINGRNYLRPEDMPAGFRAALEERVPGALQRKIDWEANERERP